MLISHCGKVDWSQAGPTRWAAIKLPTFFGKAAATVFMMRSCVVLVSSWFSSGAKLLITNLWKGLLQEKLWHRERIIRLYHQRHLQSTVHTSEYSSAAFGALWRSEENFFVCYDNFLKCINVELKNRFTRQHGDDANCPFCSRVHRRTLNITFYN